MALGCWSFRCWDNYRIGCGIMPYRRKGRVIYHKVGGEWKVKQTCESVAAAKKAFRLLQGIAHGWRPTRRK